MLHVQAEPAEVTLGMGVQREDPEIVSTANPEVGIQVEAEVVSMGTQVEPVVVSMCTQVEPEANSISPEDHTSVQVPELRLRTID